MVFSSIYSKVVNYAHIKAKINFAFKKLEKYSSFTVSHQNIFEKQKKKKKNLGESVSSLFFSNLNGADGPRRPYQLVPPAIKRPPMSVKRTPRFKIVAAGL